MLSIALHSVICYLLPYGVFFATSGANASLSIIWPHLSVGIAIFEIYDPKMSCQLP